VNNLVKKISSPYFAITDADDVSHLQRFQKQIDFLENHPDYVMIGTSYWAIDEQGILVREMKLKTDLNKIEGSSLESITISWPNYANAKNCTRSFSRILSRILY